MCGPERHFDLYLRRVAVGCRGGERNSSWYCVQDHRSVDCGVRTSATASTSGRTRHGAPSTTSDWTRPPSFHISIATVLYRNIPSIIHYTDYCKQDQESRSLLWFVRDDVVARRRSPALLSLCTLAASLYTLLTDLRAIMRIPIRESGLGETQPESWCRMRCELLPARLKHTQQRVWVVGMIARIDHCR